MAQTLLISGTDHGLGASLARLWTERGATVFAGVLGSGSSENCPSGGVLHRLPLDIGSDAGVARAAEFVRSKTDHLDLIINNGAVLGDIDSTLFDRLDFEQMLRVYNINTLGSLRVTQAFLPLLLAGEEKLVVNVSSEAGSLGTCHRQNWYAYAMAKAALNMQSCLVHNLLREHGGRVLVVHPGHVRTFMRGEVDATGALSPDEAAQALCRNIENCGLGPLEFRGPEGELIPW